MTEVKEKKKHEPRTCAEMSFDNFPRGDMKLRIAPYGMMWDGGRLATEEEMVALIWLTDKEPKFAVLRRWIRLLILHKQLSRSIADYDNLFQPHERGFINGKVHEIDGKPCKLCTTHREKLMTINTVQWEVYEKAKATRLELEMIPGFQELWKLKWSKEELVPPFTQKKAT
jgi:hypothetical protein